MFSIKYDWVNKRFYILDIQFNSTGEEYTLFVKGLPDEEPEDSLKRGLRKIFKSATDVRIPYKNGAHRGLVSLEWNILLIGKLYNYY